VRAVESQPPTQPEPSTGVLVIAEPIADGDAPRLCERLRVLLNASDAEVVVCDVHALAADAVTELDQLLSFVGLADVLGVGRVLLMAERSAEEREEPCRVEERVDRDDAVP
jgi:hypothetical protein